MTHDALIDELRKLTNKQFAELFYRAVEGRRVYESTIYDSHLVLASAVREPEESTAWTLEVICPARDSDWVDDAPICQQGDHCGMTTASWAKNSRCGICGGDVYGT